MLCHPVFDWVVEPHTSRKGYDYYITCHFGNTTGMEQRERERISEREKENEMQV